MYVNGDGSCLFRAISVCLYGVEDYHLLLRTLTSVEVLSRDVVLEESASAQGDFEAVFSWLSLALASWGLASVSTLLPRPRLCLIVSALVLARSGR